jgi:hypothetical protein
MAMTVLPTPTVPSKRMCLLAETAARAFSSSSSRPIILYRCWMVLTLCCIVERALEYFRGEILDFKDIADVSGLDNFFML